MINTIHFFQQQQTKVLTQHNRDEMASCDLKNRRQTLQSTEEMEQLIA